MEKTYLITIILLSSLLFLISCEDNQVGHLERQAINEKIGLMELRVDHYQWIGGYEGFHFKYFTQEGSEIEINKWNPNYSTIEDFDYNWGYRYHLIVNKKKYEPVRIDSPPFYYELVKVVSERKVDKDETFEIPIYKTCSGCSPILKGSKREGFRLLDSKKIECGKFCDELAKVKEKQKSVTGIFQHQENGNILLVRLTSK